MGWKSICRFAQSSYSLAWSGRSLLFIRGCFCRDAGPSVSLHAALEPRTRHGAFVPLPLSLKETGCCISYLSLNIFFYKKLEVKCVVLIDRDEHVFGVFPFGFGVGCYFCGLV